MTRIWSNSISHILLVGIQNSTATLKTRLDVSYKKLKIHLTIIPHLGIYPNEIKTCSWENLYVNVHNGFIQNPQKLETTQMDKLWYIHTTEHNVAIKRNKQVIYMTWTSPKCMVLNERNQFVGLVPLMWHSCNRSRAQTRAEQWLPAGRVSTREHREGDSGWRTVLCLDDRDGNMTAGIRQNPQNVTLK